MELLQTAALLAATMTMGIGAGVYQLYAFGIMPGLRSTDDRTFVFAFQQIDTAVVRVPFLSVFFLSPLIFSALAGALYLGADQRSALPWIGGALVLQLAIVALTIAVNVPLNNGIKAAGNPGEIDLAAERERFNEAKWVRSNLLRVAASTVAFGCLAWALILHGHL